MGRRVRYQERSLKRVEAYKYLESQGYTNFHINCMVVYLTYTIRWAGEQPVREEHLEEEAERLYAATEIAKAKDPFEAINAAGRRLSKPT